MSASDVDSEHHQMRFNTTSAKFEMFHAPSFGDEDFELTSSTSVSGMLSTSATNWMTCFSNEMSSSSSVNDAAFHRGRSPSSSPNVISGRHLDDVTDATPYNRSSFDDVSNHTSPMTSPMSRPAVEPSVDFVASEHRKYVTASSSLYPNNNNNNNVEGNFRSHPFVAPTSHYGDSMVEFSMFDQHHHHQHLQQQQHQQHHSSYHAETPSWPIADRRVDCADQLPMHGYSGVGVPAAESEGQGHSQSSFANGYFPPKYETLSNRTAVKKLKPKPAKKRKKKDTNEPQKPVSAYALFFRDTQAAIKQHNPSASFGEMSKIVASMWDSLDDIHKNIYRKRTEVAKKTYLKQLATYRANQLAKEGDSDVISGQSSRSPLTATETTASTIGDVTHAPSVIAATNQQQQVTSLSHLALVDGARHYGMTSHQQQRSCGGVPVTSHYDMYSSQLVHRSPLDVDAQVYRHGDVIQMSAMTPTGSGQVSGSGLVSFSSSSPIAASACLNYYCSPHDMLLSDQLKLESQQVQSAWWIR